MQVNFQEETQEMIRLLRETAAKEILPRFGKVKSWSKKDYKKFKEFVTEANPLLLNLFNHYPVWKT